MVPHFWFTLDQYHLNFYQLSLLRVVNIRLILFCDFSYYSFYIDQWMFLHHRSWEHSLLLIGHRFLSISHTQTPRVSNFKSVTLWQESKATICLSFSFVFHWGTISTCQLPLSDCLSYRLQTMGTA